MAFRWWVLAALSATFLKLCLASQGCGTNSPYTLGMINNDNVTTPANGSRTFHVYLPLSYDSSTEVPLVLLFHGGGGTGLGAQKYGMNCYADLYDFVVVYPDGLFNTWNGGACCGKASAANVDDMLFVNVMLDYLESILCINTAKIFATGSFFS